MTTAHQQLPKFVRLLAEDSSIQFDRLPSHRGGIVSVVNRSLSRNAELQCSLRIAKKRGNFLGQIQRIVRAMQEAAAGVGDHFAEAAVIGKHDRNCVGHRFECRQPLRFAIDGWRA